MHSAIYFEASSYVCFTDRVKLTTGYTDVTTNAAVYLHAYVQPTVAYSAIGGLPMAAFSHSGTHFLSPDPIRSTHSGADLHAFTFATSGEFFQRYYILCSVFCIRNAAGETQTAIRPY